MCPVRAPVGALALLCALAPAGARAQEPSPSPPAPPAEVGEARSTGLPPGVEWTFNFDAAAGAFGFMNSLYANPKPEQPSGDLSGNWLESYAKPSLAGTFTSAASWQIYGTVAAVGERTFAAPPSIVGEDASSFMVDDLHLGWRSGRWLGGSENVLDFTVGRAQYQLGHGMLLWDGTAEGGTRGGYWSNARRAFQFAAIGRFKPGPHTLETFYLDKDDLPEADTGSRLWGANYQYSIGGKTTIGASYLRLFARRGAAPQRDGMNVFNLRVDAASLPGIPGLSLEGEYARETNGDLFASDAWNARLAYQFGGAWAPRLSYRYAFFEGDDPATVRREAFDGLFTGFSDWGSWWQGEIAGGYFVSNSNLVSHQVRLHLQPRESIGTNLILYQFLADEPASVAPGVTARDVAFEVDWITDWEVNGNFTFSFVGAYANPGRFVEQLYDRRKDFAYGIVYVAYSY